MGASISQKRIYDKLRYLKKKNPGQRYVVLRASNGEVAIITKEWYEATTGRKAPEKYV